MSTALAQPEQIEDPRGHDLRLLKIGEVIHKTGLPRSTIYLYVSQGRFPAPRQAGGNAVRWLEHEVDRWINDLPVAKNKRV